MTYFLPLTPERAATTFAGVPCTDRSHFDLPQTVHPGDWEYETSRVLRGANGHHRCKFPKRAIAVKESSGDFAIVHVKKGNQHGHRFMKPTKEMLVYFKEAGVMLEFTRQIEKMAMRVSWASSLMDGDRC